LIAQHHWTPAQILDMHVEDLAWAISATDKHNRAQAKAYEGDD